MYWYNARVSSAFFGRPKEKPVTDDRENLSPPWWRVDRRAARQAEREARRDEKAADRAARRAARHGETPHEPITPDSVADAALRIIDAQGMDGLTVRVLAQELGVGTMTLYWYVKNKDEVLDLVADRLLAGVILGSVDSDWRISVREGAVAVRSALLAHPRAVPIIVGRGSFGPNGLRMLEGSIEIFRTAGFPDDLAANAYFSISNFVTGFCIFETSGMDSSGGAMARQSTAELARQYIGLLPPDKYPNLIATAPMIFGGDRDARFAFGVDCLIAGFEARLAQRSKSR
jgi:TetR/AcrR family tetracycline transcriptional repressor